MYFLLESWQTIVRSELTTYKSVLPIGSNACGYLLTSKLKLFSNSAVMYKYLITSDQANCHWVYPSINKDRETPHGHFWSVILVECLHYFIFVPLKYPHPHISLSRLIGTENITFVMVGISQRNVGIWLPRNMHADQRRNVVSVSLIPEHKTLHFYNHIDLPWSILLGIVFMQMVTPPHIKICWILLVEGYYVTGR